MQAMKEMFRDVLQTVMEVEMDEELGRERCERVKPRPAKRSRVTIGTGTRKRP